MGNDMTGVVRRAVGWSLALSVLMIVAGILAIAIPALAGVAVTALVAWLLIVSGVLHVVFAWRGHGPAGVVWEILLGIVYAAIGVYMLLQPVAGLETLTLALAIYLFVEATVECILWFRLRPAGGSGWLLVDGIVTFVLSAMIWSTWPSSAAWVVGTLVGISMVFSGMGRLMLSMALRRVLR
jgi:uncharacterized membrane protein HdeD (DUF308 family)